MGSDYVIVAQVLSLTIAS